MKKQSIFSFLFFITLLCFSTPVKAEINVSDENMYNSLKGKIILRVETNGEAYYVHPTKQKMYYLGRPEDAFQVMREQGIGASTDDLKKITIGYSGYWGTDIEFAKKHRGKIFLEVEKNGEAWYVNPNDSMRYFLSRPKEAFRIMREFGLGINENDFNKMQQSSCSESETDKITISDSLFCAYKRNIVKVINGNEEIIYAMNEQMPGAILGKLEHTPDESTLLFQEMGGKMSPYLMAINLKSNEAKELEGFNTIWSPNKEYVLLTDGFFDGVTINIAYANNPYESITVISTYAPTSWGANWEDNNTFQYEVKNINECIEYASDIYKEKGLVCGINEFMVKNYLK